MAYPVIKAAAYVLVHAPSIMMEHGTTLTMEKEINPNSDYLKKIDSHVRRFEEAARYAPNQVYIGNLSPAELREKARPWYENLVDLPAQGPLGEILPEPQFYGLIKMADSFNLVELSEDFVPRIQQALMEKDLFNPRQLAVLKNGRPLNEIQAFIDKGTAEGLYIGQQLVGCVRQAHESDPNLSAHVIFENLVAKASGILALQHLIRQNQLDPACIDYIIETSEEAIGDMNQRGGGNMAKAIGEVCEIVNASGIDMRGFCAAPAHGLVSAAALVQSGIFENVVVLAGGSSAKLGMNSRDHVAKNIPVLEDMLGAYAVLVSQNDGKSPVIRTDIIGKHKIGSGSAPQAVIQAIVVDPLEKHDMKITDVDIYAPELQNSEITMPAGAGDVPLANYKMIGAMAVKRGEIEKSQLMSFTAEHGMIGFAPTQGHIPSGVPAIGHILRAIKEGRARRAMIIGKGSLFLGRMTDLFDGISFIIEKNDGQAADDELMDKDEIKKEIRALVAESLQNLAESLSGR